MGQAGRQTDTRVGSWTRPRAACKQTGAWAAATGDDDDEHDQDLPSTSIRTNGGDLFDELADEDDDEEAAETSASAASGVRLGRLWVSAAPPLGLFGAGRSLLSSLINFDWPPPLVDELAPLPDWLLLLLINCC